MKDTSQESAKTTDVKTDIVESSNTESSTSESKSEEVFDFIAMLVHDLESPLASMKYALGLVQSGRYDSSKELHRRVISSAEVAGSRAESLVGDLLSVARTERHGIVANLEEVDLCEMAQQSISLATAVGVEHGVTVLLDRRNESKCSFIALADSSLLSRAMDNLIYNAIRHTPEGGKVVVSLENVSRESGQRQTVIAVTDTGDGLLGVNPEELFRKFGQVKHRKNSQHRGVGLGLYFCRLAADAMGAEIFAENTSNSGARFGFRFSSENKK